MGAEDRSVKLAQVTPFRLGEVLVDPPARRIVYGERFELLEPRVMQVLVVLAAARGSVISREELIERCWGGRIVGENAINRVISRIRQVAAELGMDSFHLETITKVGYRMVVLGEAADPAPARPVEPPPWPEHNRFSAGQVGQERPKAHPSRRLLIGGGLAAAAFGGGGLFFWQRRSGHEPHPEAKKLHDLGQVAQRQGVAEQVRQAVSHFKQATEIDPLYADAWGALALSYRHILEGFAEAELDSLPGLIESAARRALALDPDNADAQVALAIIKPYFRNWGWMEADLRRLGERYPDHWFVQAQLGIIRYEVGRWRDGLVHTERQLEIEPYIPVPYAYRARALWSLGRLQEAEAVLDAAVERWPANYALWNLKYGFLLLSGRPGSAAAFAMDPHTRPEDLRPGAIAFRTTLARAVERRRPADVEATMRMLRELVFERIDNIVSIAPVFVALGEPQMALSSLERYCLGSRAFGPPVPSPGPYERRHTRYLFTPDMAPLWREPRFAALLEQIGLERYWRESGTLPDYRRGA